MYSIFCYIYIIGTQKELIMEKEQTNFDKINAKLSLALLKTLIHLDYINKDLCTQYMDEFKISLVFKSRVFPNPTTSYQVHLPAFGAVLLTLSESECDQIQPLLLPED